MKLMMADGCIIDDEDAFQLLQDQIDEMYCIKEGENLCIPGTSHVSESFHLQVTILIEKSVNLEKVLLHITSM